MTFPWMRGVLAAAGVLAVTACSDSTGGGDPPEVDDPATVDVQLYFDWDFSRTLTAGDYTPPNIRVALVNNPTIGPAADGLTDEQGIAHLKVAPGSYTVVVNGLRGETLRMNPEPATVFAPHKGARLQVPLRFLEVPEGPVESIASVKRKPVGTVVTVEGVALTSTSWDRCVTSYVQDSTGGIQAGANCRGVNAPGDSPGRSMRITGRLYSVNGEIGVGRSVVSSAAGWPAPAPTRLITGAEAVARTYEGSHVRIDSLRVISVHNAPDGSSQWNFDVRVQAPDGTLMNVRVRNGDYTRLIRYEFVPGFTFDARGPIGSHDGTPHIWLNSREDMFVR